MRVIVKSTSDIILLNFLSNYGNYCWDNKIALKHG